MAARERPILANNLEEKTKWEGNKRKGEGGGETQPLINDDGEVDLSGAATRKRERERE